MMVAARLSMQMKLLKPEAAGRIERVVHSVGPLPAWPRMPPGFLLAWMRTDKKAQAGKMRMVLAERIGRVRVADDVPESLLLNVLTEMGAAHKAQKGAGSSCAG
jgi:3-dehydroquinate synthase